MNYSEALALVQSEFKTTKYASNCYVIRTNKTYNGANGFCVTLYNKGDKVVLSDLGETKEIFDEVPKETWESLCKENGFEFNRWSIENDFISLDDVYEYIDFLDKISDTYAVFE